MQNCTDYVLHVWITDSLLLVEGGNVSSLHLCELIMFITHSSLLCYERAQNPNPAFNNNNNSGQCIPSTKPIHHNSPSDISNDEATRPFN